MAAEEYLRELLNETEAKMQKAIEATQHDLASIRTGRANPGLVERVEVEYFGSKLPVVQLATATAPEPRLLIVAPWDKNALGPIERAIRKADLGLNPANDGNVLRIPIPPLTEETRRNLIRLVHRRVEEGKVVLRSIRREVIEELRRLKKEGDIGEDEEKRTEGDVQKLTDRYVQDLDVIQRAKEQDLMEV
ncbi:MAG: ribosome recycling factor [Armatimonadetes bacterium]|nr:ribosome recycling factor [Armatimonadota bacterium]